jgi:hypothetical protein
MRILSLRGLLLAIAYLPLPVLSGSGCGHSCTTNIVSSVQVDVVDANGVAVPPDATVTFTVDDGPSQTCEGPRADGKYYCGEDQPGHFVITASRGGMSGTGEVDVDSDACHVQPAMLTIKIE